MSDAYEFLTEFINLGRYEDCASQAHTRWLKTKLSQGWTFGEERDGDAKRHPLMLPFEELPHHIQGLNSLTPYAVANFFRNSCKDRHMPLADLSQRLRQILDDEDEATLDEIGEYVHSHFITRLLAEGETTRTRRDMVVYQDLDDETKSWDIQVALESMEFLHNEVNKYLGI